MHSEAVDEIRPGTSYVYFYAGSRAAEIADRWADEIAALVAEHGRGDRRLAVDRLDLLGVRALEARVWHWSTRTRSWRRPGR